MVVVRVVVVRVIVLQTQNSLNPDARGSVTRGSGARVSVTNAKLSKSFGHVSGTNSKCSKSSGA